MYTYAFATDSSSQLASYIPYVLMIPVICAFVGERANATENGCHTYCCTSYYYILARF